MKNEMNFRDIEQASAYLDGQLSRTEAARLEARLARDPGLSAAMDEMRRTRAVLRAAPKRRAPRNFTLKPESQRVRPPVPRSVPVLRFASAFASLLLVFMFATNFIVPRTARSAQPVMFGIGGGGGDGNVESAPMLSEAPAEIMPPAPTQGNAMAPMATQPPEMDQTAPAGKRMAWPVNGNTGLGQPAPAAPQAPFALGWQVSLLIVALLLGGLAYLLNWQNDRRWQRKP